MLIKCLGAGCEVGRNGILLHAEEKNERILFDYGLKVETGEIPLPAENVNSLLLSHPHLDHSGSVPVLFRKSNPKVYSTISSFEQSHLLLKDSMKIARIRERPQNFSESDMDKMIENEVRITYGQQFETSSSSVDSIDAGHIPGSCMFIVEVEGKRIMYTGDFNLNPTRLLNGANISNVKDIDVLIMENTYSSRNHPPREQIEKQLVELVQSTIANDGIAVIPAFAVGRAAEILMVLDTFKHSFPIYMDGMAKQATQIALDYPEFLKNSNALRKAAGNVTLLHDEADRRKAIKQPCAIITTGGCLEGGPVVEFIKQLYQKEECSLIFTGFMIPKTAGRYLQDTGRFVHEGVDLKVKMATHFLDFSAHSGRDDLFKLINEIRPKKVIAIHGDNCERFATEIKGRYGIPALAPSNGETLKI